MTVFPDVELQESKDIFSVEELARLDPKKIPTHVAIIMDGNRRWAKQRHLPPMLGHWEGAEGLIEIVRAASEMGIKTLTVYSFSTENWIRSEAEVEGLMNVFELYLVRKREAMIKDGVRLDAIGDVARFPPQVLRALEETKRATAHGNKINLVLAMSYGGRDEIRRAMVKILALHEKKEIGVEGITEELIASQLDTARFGDPELLIRTSGEMRVSNFLLWQISYAEIYTTEVLWPDFSPKCLYEAILAYQARAKRKGG